MNSDEFSDKLSNFYSSPRSLGACKSPSEISFTRKERKLLQEADEAMMAEFDQNRFLDNPFLRLARKYPVTYTKTVGYMLIMSELVAMLTPTGIKVYAS